MSKYPNLIEAGLKVGDTVDGILGELTVTGIEKNDDYPIKAGNGSFTATGMLFKQNERPSIWFKSDTDWFNPPMSPPEPDHMKEFYTDRPVWVRDNGVRDNGCWVPRYAALYITKSDYKFCVFSNGKNKANASGLVAWRYVSYTKPEGAEDHE